MPEQNLPRSVQSEYDRIAKSLTVTDEQSLQVVLATISQLDKIRWDYPVNYSSVNTTLVNYAFDDLTADEKLLSHWLCYITDRQMPYQRIWEVGGYLFSHLARTYSRQTDSNVSSIMAQYLRSKNQQSGGVYFECDLVAGNARAKERLDAFVASDGGKVQFASRFAPNDAVRIFHTLAMLDRISERSLSRFISQTLPDLLESAEHYRHAIRRAAASLDALTYHASRQVSSANLISRMAEADTDANMVADLYSANHDRLMDRWLQDFRPFGRKRLWCSLRDYLKSPELNQVFVETLVGLGYPDPALWHRRNARLEEALDAIELPGDVWNNNSVFRKGLFDPFVQTNTSLESAQVVRGIYQYLAESGVRVFYPEQLDVTFDFVPRMCEKRMCDRCMFGAGIGSLCNRQEGTQCPVTMPSCGYQHECMPEACPFVADSARGLCGVWKKTA